MVLFNVSATPTHQAFSLTILHASWMQRLSRATQCERNWILDQAQTPNVCSKEGFKGGQQAHRGGRAVTRGSIGQVIQKGRGEKPVTVKGGPVVNKKLCTQLTQVSV